MCTSHSPCCSACLTALDVSNTFLVNEASHFIFCSPAVLVMTTTMHLTLKSLVCLPMFQWKTWIWWALHSPHTHHPLIHRTLISQPCLKVLRLMFRLKMFHCFQKPGTGLQNTLKARQLHMVGVKLSFHSSIWTSIQNNNIPIPITCSCPQRTGWRQIFFQKQDSAWLLLMNTYQWTWYVGSAFNQHALLTVQSRRRRICPSHSTQHRSYILVLNCYH